MSSRETESECTSDYCVPTPDSRLPSTDYSRRRIYAHTTTGLTLRVSHAARELGIGANTAVFSIINAILLKPIALPDLDRIVVLWEKLPSQGVERNEASVANYLDWRAQQSSFEQLAIYTWWGANLTGVEPPERVRGFRVSANLFEAIGVKPALGRGFLPDEDQPGKDSVAILSYGLWQRRFGG